MEPTSLASAGDRGRNTGGDEPPAAFRAALAALDGVRVRPEIRLEHIPAPQRLAPWAHAVSRTAFRAARDASAAERK